MTLVVTATVGGATSNAYQDVASVTALLLGVPNTTAFTTATSGAKDIAVVYATTLLEVLAYKGARVGTTQALNWPRIWVVDPDYSNLQFSTAPFGPSLDTWPGYLSSTAIPVRVLRAHAQLTLEICRAGTADIWGTDNEIDLKRKTVDVLTKEWYDRAQRRTGLRTYPNVWREIFPLTMASEPQHVDRA